MARNKKAQILAAVMCASSIFGSYTVVSAADTPTKIESTDKNSSVTANGSTITAIAKNNNDNQQSKIILQGNNFNVSVGGATTSSLALKDGTFTLNSSNVAVSGSTLTMKSSTSPYTAALANTGLTIKNDANKILASLTNTGLTVNGTSTSSIKAENATTGAYVKNEITSGTMTTTARGGMYPSDADNKNKTTSQVSATGVRDTVYDDGGNIKSTSVVDTNGVTLTSNRYDTGSKISSSLTIKGDSATLASGSASVTLNNTTGNVAITANQKGSQGYVTLSGKNVNLDRNGLTLYKDNAEGTKTQYAALNSSGLSINNNANFDKFGTNSYNTTFKATNSEQSYNLEKWTAGNLENKVSSKLDTSGLTTTVQSKGNDAGIENTNSTKNKTTSQVAYNGVTDTVYDANGKQTSKSSVGTTSIANTVYDDNGSTIIATSNLYKNTDKNSGNKYGYTSLSASDYGDVIDKDGNLVNKQLGNTSLKMNESNANKIALSASSYEYDENLKQTATTASMTLDGNSGIVSLSGKNVNLDGDDLTLYKDANGTKTSYAALTASGGLTIYGDNGTSSNSTLSKSGLNVNGTGTSTIKIINKETNATIAQSQVLTSGVADTVYNANGIKTSYSNVGTTSITDTVYANNGSSTLATSTLSKSTATNEDVTTESGKVSLTAQKIVTDNKTSTTPTTTTSSLTLDGENVLFSGKNVNLTSTGLTVNGTNTVKATNSTTEAYVKNEITSGAMTTTARGGMYPSDADNKNKTTSQVSATGVRDNVYDDGGQIKATSSVTTSGITNTVNNSSITNTVNDVNTGKALANSSLTTSGISNTTTALQMTGTNAGNTMSTGIYQNNGGISATATKKDVDGNTIGISTLSLGGNSASLKVGNYGFAVDSSNNASITGNNATLSGSIFTLKDTDGKTATLSTSGLALKDANGTQVGGVSAAGAVTGTSLNITAKNDAGNKTISKVDATSVTDTVYGTDGTTQVASSSVGISGISNNTNISGIAIKDDVNNTKRMTTSIAQNANGVSISSTKYNVYNDGTSKVQTTDGISSISVNGAKTTISGYGNYEYEKDENGNLILDDKGNPIRSSNTSASLSVDGESGIINLSGKNVNLNENGLTLYKDAEGVKTQYASLTASGLNVNSIGTTTIKSTNATTGAMGQSQLSYNGITDTVTNVAGNKTTSTINATSVTDTVYDTDGTTRVASSSVGTSGISNTTTALQMTGTNAGNTMSTGIYQNNGGISATATKKDVDGNTIGTSTLSLGGNSASLKVGNYGFAVDSSNNVSITGNNATLSGSTFTLKDVNTGKTAILNTNGLTLKDGDGTITGGISTTGAVTGTSLRITTSEDAGGNKTVSTVATNAVTDTVTNTKTNNKTTSQVSATGVRDTVYDANNKTVASSTVTTSGISNNTNISGIAIKDDKYNTKTMTTSIAQNANGVSISSTKYNVYNDGTNTVQTTDGTSSISVNGAKTTISGYGNYEYEKDENGKLVVSSRNSASLSVDGESGIISLSGKNVGLSANGLTLYKDVEGVKTQYASLTAGGLNVNGTGTTTIKSTNATTGAMGQSQLSYNGVTDTVTNAAGNKTTSTVNATGTIDQVYDTDGKTRIAYSNITTTGITDSFTKDGITNSVTTNANGTTFASTGNGSTTIKGGAITTNSITVAGNTIDGGFFDTIGQTNGNTAGIVRTEINGDWITSIEGALDISRSGNISLNADKLTYSYNDGKNSGTLGALANKVDDIYDRTQGIDYDKATGTTTIDGNLSVKDETTTGGTGSTGETGTTPTNGNITANTANIGGVQIGKNAVTATTGNFDNVVIGGTEGTSISKDGVTVGDKKSDNYTSITNNDVVVNNNGSKTSLTDVGNRVTGLESSVSSMNNRLNDVEDRIDKVGAMAAAIANLRTMGYDPEAPTEIAVGIGQYKSDTGLALGIFHYPNQDFMLSASISTSGDEVMGGIGATWKLGRKSGAEKAKDAEAKHLKKAEEMKKLAQESKVKAQAERHAKLLAEREAQKTA